MRMKPLNLAYAALLILVATGAFTQSRSLSEEVNLFGPEQGASIQIPPLDAARLTRMVINLQIELRKQASRTGPRRREMRTLVAVVMRDHLPMLPSLSVSSQVSAVRSLPKL